MFWCTISFSPHQREADGLRIQLKNKEKEANLLGKQLTEVKTKADTAERQGKQLEVSFFNANLYHVRFMCFMFKYTDRSK